jgi:cytochrome c553
MTTGDLVDQIWDRMQSSDARAEVTAGCTRCHDKDTAGLLPGDSQHLRFLLVTSIS